MNLTLPIGWEHYECGLFTFAKKSQKQIRGRQNHFQSIDAQKFQINRWLLAWMAVCLQHVQHGKDNTMPVVAAAIVVSAVPIFLLFLSSKTVRFSASLSLLEGGG